MDGKFFPILEHDSDVMAVINPSAVVGAPLSAAFLEEMIALGSRCFVACGGAGVLKKDLAAGHLVVPVSAIRNEGTSYHYLPPKREVTASQRAVEAIKKTLDTSGIAYVTGKTWTTDAVYSETSGKIALRVSEGCLTVEIEAAAFFAVAQFRKVDFGQVLYGGDDVSGIDWDRRQAEGERQRAVREKLLWLSVAACVEMSAG